uniref:Uncharacterized protein n=1 Tax=Trichobilharzia regenti TaxID=157069 RepID=A0AA85JPT2_TRIRE|nr:unnamed protein product [Trichobilharzia regenti]
MGTVKYLITTVEEEMQILQDRLETQAAERNTTIAECISGIIRKVNQSYGGFFVMPANNTLWIQSLIHGSVVNAGSGESTPDLTVCDSLLSVERTEALAIEISYLNLLSGFSHVRYHAKKE